ncbi:MAG: SPOR domain-containing protein [Betaproteobacteria bacterium]|nr:SPOR domain-containing protein [Betaproteobacteria bacterium]
MTDQPELITAERELKRRGRRRLAGAVTLGLLAFVFVPMFFDDEPKKPGQRAKTEISVQIPPKDGQPALPAPGPAVATPGPAPASAPDAKALEPVKVPTPPVEPAPSPVKEAAKEPAKEPVKEPAKASVKEPKVSTPPAKDTKPVAAAKTAAKEPAAAKGAFAVQLGAFSDADKVKESIARLKDAGLPHYTESVAVSGGKVTRVRAGPFDTKDKAEAALAKVKLAGGDGKVVPR